LSNRFGLLVLFAIKHIKYSGVRRHLTSMPREFGIVSEHWHLLNIDQ
jgi:hypothetical protein